MLEYKRILKNNIKNMSILDGIELLSGLLESEKDNLAMFCQEKHLEPGDVLFSEEEDASAMYLLKNGSIEISRNIDGAKSILGQVHSEEILGEMALFGDTNKRMATATALESCTLVVILSFSIKELAYNHPDLLSKIQMIINDRMIKNKDMG